MTSFDIYERISELHQRKGNLIAEISGLQQELSQPLKNKQVKTAALKIATGELGQVNEMLTSYSIVLKSTKERKMLDLLKSEYSHIHSRLEIAVKENLAV